MSKVRLITSNLIHDVKRLIQKAENIYWIVAFAMPSGVRLVLPYLKEAAKNGAEIKLLVGDYLYITHPEALKLLLHELPEAEIRMYESRGISFHPKAYLFKEATQNHVIVGSSNLSTSAMTKGIEWNVHTPSTVDEDLFETAVDEFMKHFLSPNTRQINEETLILYEKAHQIANHEVAVSQVWDKYEEVEPMFGEQHDQDIIYEEKVPYTTRDEIVTPRPAQSLALEALEQTRAEDYQKALVVLATGLGKTYLAAFFAQYFKKVLFIAHREEILTQAQASFEHVHPNASTGLYNGQVKEPNTDFLFASVFTLGTNYHLEKFAHDAFDLIVVDEFHHAVAPTYERILNHFTPEFLLGITATPDRLDNKDVYSLCDGNVAISIHFLEAIRRQWLAPFIYYGIHDETDYSHLKWHNNGYDEDELLRLQLRDDYAHSVLTAWKKHKQTRTLGFCSSVKQAIFLSEYFNKAGYNTIALHGATQRNLRKQAREQLEKGKVDVIFTIDLFNEGVDIPSVDTLLFARPTESLTVFTQQIGRGLRIADGKSHCVIIDLIGNYQNADVKMQVFSEEGNLPKSFSSAALQLPENCDFHLDLQVVDLLKEMKKKHAPRKQQLVDAFYELKTDLGRRPTYLEFHLKAHTDSQAIRQEFDTYVGLLAYAKELTDQELEVFAQYKQWLFEVTRTGMTKSYKMIVLKFMLSKGAEHWLTPIKAKEVAPFFHHYLTSKEHRIIDFSDKQVQELRVYNEKKITSLIHRMPMTAWSGSSKGLISYVDRIFVIHVQPIKAHEKLIYEWTKEICDYRLHTYFERKAAKL